jgi:hypothetical protein
MGDMQTVADDVGHHVRCSNCALVVAVAAMFGEAPEQSRARAQSNRAAWNNHSVLCTTMGTRFLPVSWSLWERPPKSLVGDQIAWPPNFEHQTDSLSPARP